MFVSQRAESFVAETTKERLLFLRDLVESGQLVPVVERTYDLTETSEALRYMATGHARGKLVITV